MQSCCEKTYTPALCADGETLARAKWLLQCFYHMTEPEAHRFILKSAMDNCVKRRVVAEGIIRALEEGRIAV